MTTPYSTSDRRVVAGLRDALAPADVAATVDRLGAGLADRAAARGLLDVAVRDLDSPVGPLLVAVTERGVVRVAFASQDRDAVVADLAERVSPRILATTTRTDEVARELDEYFTGRRRHFDVPVDLALAHGFRRRVVDALTTIPYGQTRSYGAVAGLVDNPRAVRAVGSACGHNPVPVLVPCHRVVRADGSPGGYVGGAWAKQVLLDLEAAVSNPS